MSHLRSIPALLFALLMVVPLPFLPEFGGANSSTRLMLTAALVDEGSTRIDRHSTLTIDKARVGDHYYSDKAPGMALLAVPAYAVGRAVAPKGTEALFQLTSPLDILPRSTMLIWRAIAWTTGGILMALAGVAIYRMGLRIGGDRRAALMASISVCLATPVLGWSTQFFGHVGAGAALAIAFSLCTGIKYGPGLLSAGSRATLVGAALSLAVTIEYTAGGAAMLIALYALWHITALPGRKAWRLFALGFAAALVAALPILFYHFISFGSPFSVGYSSVVGFEGMDQGFLGLTTPNMTVLGKIIYGFQRGILWLSPLLVLVPVGIWLGLRRRDPKEVDARGETLLCLSVIVYYFLLNASYYYWSGGSSVGPRHTIPAVFFAALPLLWLWKSWQGNARTALQGLFAISLFFSLACASMTMVVPGRMRFPLKDPILENLLTDQNVFFRMQNWGLPPILVFGAWLVVSLGLLWLLWRATANSQSMSASG
ncbi:hypothetical protein [uncultured Roseobacter sp.]|uniref:hypothetical protein n=1 Tax=uncultured Roseobacter sp. TaxID=114847 RepID=UPI0026296FB0|nr:hypothetical protein [uncultured Roseobacter sp.]